MSGKNDDNLVRDIFGDESESRLQRQSSDDDEEGDFEEMTADNAKELFGSESEDEEGEGNFASNESARSPSYLDAVDAEERELFGAGNDDDDKTQGSQGYNQSYSSRADDEDQVESIREERIAEAAAPKSNGGKLFFASMPNFLRVDPRPFDPDTYEEEIEHNDGGVGIKLKVDNTMRWRYVQQANGQTSRESNARFIKWSDGSLSLLLGSEIFDVQTTDIANTNQFLVSTHAKEGLLVTQAHISDRMTFRPSTQSNETHKKLASAIAGKYKKKYKTQMITTTEDPEIMKQRAEKAEAERLRTQRRMESSRRAVANKYNLTEDMLEASDDEILEGGYGKGAQREDDDLGDFVVDDEEYDPEAEREKEEKLMRSKRRSNEDPDSRKRRRDDYVKEGGRHVGLDANLLEDDDEDTEMVVKRNVKRGRAVVSSDEDEEE